MLDIGRGENVSSAAVAGDSVANVVEPGAGMEPSGRGLIQTMIETAKAMAESIRALPGDDVATLQGALRQLNLDQFDFVYDVLESEVADGRMTRKEFRRFESFVDRWWTHDLSLKLAFLHHVCAFTNFHEWPWQIFPELPKLRIDYGVRPGVMACRKLG